jgi:serine/threonine protein phosphatase 1
MLQQSDGDRGLIAIGDLHGCAKTLDAMLAKLQPRLDEHLVFIGDYVDRGPDSRGVLSRLIELEQAAYDRKGPTCTFLRGNHDQMMLDYLDTGGSNLVLWRMNGGLSTIANYLQGPGDIDVPPDHVAFQRRTELLYETEEFVFVHAGLDAERTIEENVDDPDPRVLLWTRSHFDADLSIWDKTVVCGHTPMATPLSTPRLVAIDTGAAYSHVRGLGRLTAVRLPEREFVHVDFCD